MLGVIACVLTQRKRFAIDLLDLGCCIAFVGDQQRTQRNSQCERFAIAFGSRWQRGHEFQTFAQVADRFRMRRVMGSMGAAHTEEKPAMETV